MKLMKTHFGLIAAFALAVMLPACGSTSPSNGTLGIEDLVVGTGATVVTGDLVTVNYTGTFTNGTVFDSSLQAGRTPYSFWVGAGSVITEDVPDAALAIAREKQINKKR